MLYIFPNKLIVNWIISTCTFHSIWFKVKYFIFSSFFSIFIVVKYWSTIKHFRSTGKLKENQGQKSYKKPIINHFTKSEEQSFVFLIKPLSLSQTANVGHPLVLLSSPVPLLLTLLQFTLKSRHCCRFVASISWVESFLFSWFRFFFPLFFFAFASRYGWWLTATQVVLEVVVWWCCGSVDVSVSLTMVLDLLGYWVFFFFFFFLVANLVFIYLFIIILHIWVFWANLSLGLIHGCIFY